MKRIISHQTVADLDSARPGSIRLDLKHLLLAAALCPLLALAAPPTPPAPPASALPDLGGGLAARLRPMGGTPPAQPLGDGAAVLPVNFAGTAHERVSWDVQTKIDASRARGIRFDFYCADITPVSQFVCYLRSGGGWYRAEFCPETVGQWETVTLDKALTSAEEAPGGWAGIDTLRISAWRGGGSDTTCAIANIALAEGPPPQILVVRADSRMREGDPETQGYASYAATVSQTLDAIGIPNAQVADLDFAGPPPDGVRLVVLPYNPSLPDAALAALEKFVEGGGRLLACYNPPPPVLRLIGLRNTGYVEAGGEAFLGFAKTPPGLEGQPDFAAQGSRRTMVTGPAEGGEARVVAVWRKADGSGGPPAVTLTPRGGAIGHVWFKPSDDGAALMQSIVCELVPEFAEQAARAARARALKKAALETWCKGQPPRGGEFRAFWCHSAFGLADGDWDRAIRLLKESGFNAILPNMLWAGVAYYPSDVLPQYSGIAEGGDQIAKCLAACRKHGVKMHVWKVNWNTGGHAPKAFIEMLAREGRHQVTYSGDTRAEWLCPSHPANQELEVASMLEVVRRYDVDGIHFDYIRYPDNDSCYCGGCKARFRERLGRPVDDWAQTRPGGPLHDAWQDFRRDAISAVVKRVHDGAKAIRPGVQVSAAVFASWHVNRDRIAQDWKLWCDNGWLDFVCPMDYTDSVAMFAGMVGVQKGLAGDVPLYPGIGLSCWREPGDPVRLLRQIEALRAAGAPGFTIFNYDRHAESVLPLLRLGATKEN